MIDTKNLTIKKAQEMLAKKEILPEELAQVFLKRTHEENPKLNAYLSIFENAPGGIPGCVKDVIMVEGEKCTAASKILENYVASYDATVVKKLRALGVSILGKGNCDEFAMGSTGEYSAFGPTRNPFDTDRVAGGSSSGPAAAIAGGMALWGLGSETGGSIRMPAAWCGIVGVKPSYGLVSRHGLLPMAASVNQIGPFAKNVEDAAWVMQAIAGRDPLDSASSPLPVPDYSKSLNQSIKGMKIAVVKEYFGDGLDPQVKELTLKAIKQLESLGAHVEEVSLPMTKYALATYYVLVPSEISADLARYDGIRYGLSVSGKTLLDTYLETRDQGFGPEAKRRVMIGTYALSAGYYDAYYKKAQQVRTLIRQEFDTMFSKYDVIVGPTAPCLAPKIGEFDNPLAFYLADAYMIQANLGGICAISVPCGFGEINGVKLPSGLHIMAKQFDEATMFKVAHAYEKAVE